MIWITKEQIIEFQEKLIRKTGGSFGLRDEGGLESCIYSPLQSFDGKEFYSSIIDKASRVSYLLVNNHPFIDGNKRIGALTLLYILEVNKINYTFNNKELIDSYLSLAAGEITYQQFDTWVKDHILDNESTNENILRLQINRLNILLFS